MGKNQDGDRRKGLKNKKYDKELRRLQGELCKLQDWVKHNGLRVIVIFDRSWYNRAGVEYVMGFCTKAGLTTTRRR